jgi:hypothetical protein
MLAMARDNTLYFRVDEENQPAFKEKQSRNVDEVGRAAARPRSGTINQP